MVGKSGKERRGKGRGRPAADIKHIAEGKLTPHYFSGVRSAATHTPAAIVVEHSTQSQPAEESARARALARTSTNTSPIVTMASPAFLLLLLLAVSITGSDAEWCVCRSDANETALQETLDYACGQGADCAPVATGGSCHSPDSVVAHCSYAVNSYYQRSSQTKGATCDFGGTATLSSADPSSGTCKYPATASAAGTSTGNGTATGTGTGTNTSSPGSTNPATPGMGGSFTTPIGSASGPTASIIGPESSGVAAAAAAFAGVRGLVGVAVASVLAF